MVKAKREGRIPNKNGRPTLLKEDQEKILISTISKRDERKAMKREEVIEEVVYIYINIII